MAKEDQIRNLVRDIVRQALTESNIASAPDDAMAPTSYQAPWTGVEYEAHPSRRQFDVGEASTNAMNAAAIGDLLEFVESKLCTIEKNRICDHCGMCRSLGF